METDISFARLVLAGASAILLAACATVAPVPTVPVMVTAETAPAGATGDAADDPAVWRHPADPAQSLTLGTNKQEGLVVHALDGSERQRLPIGPINNVDVREVPGSAHDIAVASNDTQGISVFSIDRTTGEVKHVNDVPTGKTEPYGICLGLDEGAGLAGVTYKDGTVELWQLNGEEDGFTGTLARSAILATQLEGCVFDEVNGTLVIGEEGHGVWSLAYKDAASAPAEIDTIAANNGLVADVEGVSIWRGQDGKGWIVASAQAADRYVVYERQAPHAVMGVFTLTANTQAGIDKVTHTDVFSGALPGYPRGLLVVQDDGNPKPERDQNFKLVDWSSVEAALGLPVLAAD
ncbi:MAG: 3-phytase [Hyphomonas sp. BRH_c22]|uniref:phytase n=1 Tax=Hyphomonas sp. BRH_c22 TaxID=1629710 RepID=UPI00061ED2D8|nr:phytase [Hyphomonas sp. BRH_c22]KJS37276.1 MAG: 3-phytase [Hyphomonas sp. BRH_c22]